MIPLSAVLAGGGIKMFTTFLWTTIDGIDYCANHPVPFVSALLFWSVINSSLFHFVAVMLGLDHNSDGKVDFMDIVDYFKDRCFKKKTRLSAEDLALKRLASLEDKLDILLKKISDPSESENKKSSA